MPFMRTMLLACSLMFALAPSLGSAQELLMQPPQTIDPAKKYLFFLHGLSVEQQGPNAYSREFRKVNQNTAVAQALAGLGYVVMADIRPRGTKVQAYAAQLAEQVRQLLAAGVPARHIALVGHSKGGYIAIATATRLAMPGISYAILAGCALPTTRNIGGTDARATYESLVAEPQGQLAGRFLSLYDTTDAWMGSCRELQTANPNVALQETALDSGMAAGMGHSLFFAPEPIWMEPLAAWLAATD